jgi:hypothetical protein
MNGRKSLFVAGNIELAVSILSFSGAPRALAQS